MEDRIDGILPALVHQALFGRPPVFDEAVAIRIARAVDPAERGLDGGPQRGNRRHVAGSLGIKARKQDEQRRRIDAAVVEPERNLAQRRHFARTHLMQDLAGLASAAESLAVAWIGREPAQHAARDGGVAPQHLHRGDQAVAAECGRVPGNAGVRISPLGRAGAEHGEVGGRAAQHFVEEIVRRLDRRHARSVRRAVRDAPRASRAWKASGLGSDASRADGHEAAARLAAARASGR